MEFREEMLDTVRQIQLSTLVKQQYSVGGKRFGYRSKLEGEVVVSESFLRKLAIPYADL